MLSKGPIGYFVHHQGRGHAERAAAIANALIDIRPITLFCARPDIFPELDPRVEVVRIPSLFERTGGEEERLAKVAMPQTVHCAPLGWPGITEAFATIANWFEQARPALFITDVSAELGQLARLCSVPHVAVLQHGERGDPGHMAAYESAVGILAPYCERLEQSERPQSIRRKTHYAAGVGIHLDEAMGRSEARDRLGIGHDEKLVLVMAGGGGEGTPSTPLTLGARADSDSRWVTIGQVRSEWHETSPGNLEHKGWVDNAGEWIAASDRIVSSCGNTTVHQVLAAGKPWVVVPEWRYFDEQFCKAEVLDREGLAAVSRHWPSHAESWNRLWQAAEHIDRQSQQEFVDPNAADGCAAWLDDLAGSLWNEESAPARLEVVA